MALEMKRNRVVVGLFTHRTDAYRALEELREADFPPDEIGAAFRSMENEGWFPSGQSEEETQELIRRREAAYSGPGVTGVGSGAAGAASGTNTVTPAGLSTGGGTTTTGPGRPGPIPGAEIPHHRRTSEEETGSLNTAGEVLAAPGQMSMPNAAQMAEQRDWWQRVRNIFGSDEERMRRKEGIPEDAVDYGTGVGHLPLQAPVSDAAASATGWSKHAYSYEVGSFGDLLADLGLEPEAARYFSTLLPPGGAVLTVQTTSRISEAELIMEGNKGRVRIESGQPEGVDLGEQYDDDRIAVFGEVQRACQRRGMERSTSAEDLEGFPGRIGNLRRPA